MLELGEFLLFFMNYRQSAENPGINWGKKFEDFYTARGDTASEYFVEVMEQTDNFVPKEVNKMAETDLSHLLDLSDEIYQLAMKMSYFFFFLHIVNKSIILLLDQFPDLFEKLSDEQKEKVFGIKIEIPTEVELYHNVYTYLWGITPMPLGTFSMGISFRTLLERIALDKPDMLKTSLLEVLDSINNQYAIYLSELDFDETED